MSKYTALDIANWFIWRNTLEEPNSEKISLLKVLKLLYYAEGCSLALGRGSLFDEPIVAWEHGPVVTDVYFSFPDAYNLEYDDKSVEKINKNLEDKDLLEQVFEVFGSYTAWALRNKTHRETPWINATDNGRVLKKEISRDDMKKYFAENYIEA